MFEEIFAKDTRKPQQIKFYYAYDMIVEGLRHFCGDKAEWLDGYDQIVEWLKDNKGKGLLCMGDAGLGKTLICEKIIPKILNHKREDWCGIQSAYDMANSGETEFNRGITMIDDVGVEGDFSDYGIRRNVFCEIVDSAERNQRCLILTTNMNPEQLASRYGARTMDRLRAITTPVLLTGESFRGKESLRKGIPIRYRAYGMDFSTEEEAVQFEKEQTEIRNRVSSGEIQVNPQDRLEYEERQPMRIYNGVVCALLKYDWTNIGSKQ